MSNPKIVAISAILEEAKKRQAGQTFKIRMASLARCDYVITPIPQKEFIQTQLRHKNMDSSSLEMTKVAGSAWAIKML
jgi:hypothetical protein